MAKTAFSGIMKFTSVRVVNFSKIGFACGNVARVPVRITSFKGSFFSANTASIPIAS